MSLILALALTIAHLKLSFSSQRYRREVDICALGLIIQNTRIVSMRVHRILVKEWYLSRYQVNYLEDDSHSSM